MKNCLFIALFLFASMALPPPSHAGGGEKKPAHGEEAAPAEPDVVVTIMEDEHLTQFAKLLEASGMSAALHEAGPFTIFAPHDSAFEEISEERMEELLSKDYHDELIELMEYHIMPGPMLYRHMVRGQTAVAVMNKDLVILKRDDNNVVTIDGHKILTPDITVTNGWIHIIDHILEPGVN
jgi:uncharacterized surface protein with fasciclin (FAS1) repeats